MSTQNVVVIVGRMNVGKSTLFNKLSERVKSITLDYPGVTRDVIKDTVTWKDRAFELVDTGGISLRKTQDVLLEQVRQRALSTMEQADTILFVVDGTTGIMPEDREIAKLLHRLGKKVILVINKIDNKATQEHQDEFATLGFKNILAVSAEHSLGINDVLDAIVISLPEQKALAQEKPTYRVVLLGRPNVGKSSLMNAILQQERSIVSDIPGTTREAVTEHIAFYKENLALTDTPGIRRPRAVSGQLEPLMVKSSLDALKKTDIVLLLIDVTEAKLVDQELKLAFYAFTEQYKALIILFNKTDMLTDVMQQDLDRSLSYYKHLMDKVPTLNISCKTGKNVGKVLPLIKKVWERYSQQLPNEEINRLCISELQKKPLMRSGHPLRVYHVRQLTTAPITIGMEVNEPLWFEEAQLGFFENLLRDNFDLVGVPIKFVVKKSL